MIQAIFMAGFHRDMPGNHEVLALRADTGGDKRGSSRNISIHHDGNPVGSRSQHDTGQSSNFQTPYFSQYIQCVGSLRFIQSDSFFNDFDFMF